MIPNRLAELREAHDLKPYELAVEVGVDPSTIYRWQRGGPIPDGMKVRLAGRFGVTVAYLMLWDEAEALAA